MKSIKGKQFGYWTVLSYEGKYKYRDVWKCRCSCGTEKLVQERTIINGQSTSCGACAKNVKDNTIVGNKYGYLTVVSFAYTKDRRSYWNCVCDCGNQKVVSLKLLKNGHTKSCGCATSTKGQIRHDIKGLRFGKLTAIECKGTKNSHTYWKCLCDCGNYKDVELSALITGHTTSCGSHTYSLAEKEVVAYVKSIYKGTIVENDRVTIAPKELDIYIPSKNVAIEYNGLIWHSEKCGCDRTHHKQKTELCINKGIRLIQIRADEWQEKNDICKSMISSALGIYERKEYARNCTVKEITDKNIVHTFFNENHIQGTVHKYSLCLGLYKGEELLQAVIFGKQHFGKNNDVELYRMVTKLNTQVLGGFSKLMEHSPYETVVSYVGLRLFDGKGYLASKWRIESKSQPSFALTDGKHVYSRHLYKKQKCIKTFTNVNPNMTEKEMQELNGLYRIWDCGTYKVRYIKG